LPQLGQTSRIGDAAGSKVAGSFSGLTMGAALLLGTSTSGLGAGVFSGSAGGVDCADDCPDVGDAGVDGVAPGAAAPNNCVRHCPQKRAVLRL
jgi:hypothetical protein